MSNPDADEEGDAKTRTPYPSVGGRKHYPNPDFSIEDDFSLQDDFCVLILSYNRPENIPTISSLERHGYTGDWYLVIDDPDDREPYINEYGEDRVVYFEKDEIADEIDRGDNFNRRNVNIYARNKSFEIARSLGYDYFLLLDDDYEYFQQRFAADYTYGPDGPLKLQNLDRYIRNAVEFLETAGLDTVCMAQGGDFIGGENASLAQAVQAKRKSMNTFLFRSEPRVEFRGSINEDVNTYTRAQQLGEVHLTVNFASVDQEDTQQEEGGLTDTYLTEGTYIKSFYTILYCPASVGLGMLHDRWDPRIHHRVDWRKTVPKIIPERVKGSGSPPSADDDETERDEPADEDVLTDAARPILKG